MSIHTFVTTLSDKAILRCSGADAQRFLQGQLTCDLNVISEVNSSLAAYCDQKGRVLATILVFKREDGFYLSLSLDLLDNILIELKKYVMRSKVTLESMHPSWTQLGYVDSNAFEHLREWIGPIPVPDQINAVLSNNEISLICLGKNPLRFQIIGNTTLLEKLKLHLQKYTDASNLKNWNLFNIMEGIPTIEAATTGQFTPHALNLPNLNAVSFNKGCYRGQEIVARMQYLGKSKQYLASLVIETPLMPSAGSELFDSQDHLIAYVINSACIVENKCHVLAVLQLEREQLVSLQEIKLIRGSAVLSSVIENVTF